MFLFWENWKPLLLTQSKALSTDTAKQAQHSTCHRASEQQINTPVVCLQQEADKLSPGLSSQTRLLDETHHHATLTLPRLTKVSLGLTSSDRAGGNGAAASALGDIASI